MKRREGERNQNTRHTSSKLRPRAIVEHALSKFHNVLRGGVFAAETIQIVQHTQAVRSELVRGRMSDSMNEKWKELVLLHKNLDLFQVCVDRDLGQHMHRGVPCTNCPARSEGCDCNNVGPEVRSLKPRGNRSAGMHVLQITTKHEIHDDARNKQQEIRTAFSSSSRVITQCVRILRQ